MIIFHIKSSTLSNLQETFKKILAHSIEWVVADDGIPEELMNLVVEFCKENGIILCSQNNEDILISHKLHGIFYTDDFHRVTKIRDNVGGHPIIGLSTDNIELVRQLTPHDIDIICFEKGTKTIDELSEFIQNFKKISSLKLVISAPSFKKSEANHFLQMGADGFYINEI